jgi:hypothetical protein
MRKRRSPTPMSSQSCSIRVIRWEGEGSLRSRALVRRQRVDDERPPCFRGRSLGRDRQASHPFFQVLREEGKAREEVTWEREGKEEDLGVHLRVPTAGAGEAM